jgi:pimeloyl-ACP methyl ester carboxylesterase
VDPRARHGLAAVLALAARRLVPPSGPRYAHLDPIAPSELWAPLPVRHVEVDGVDVAYVDSGGPITEDPRPPVVLVHGLSSWMGFWGHQIPHLAATRRVLALDLPGFGASARPDAPYTMPWYARTVDRWLAALGIGRAVIVGHSMGGQIALSMALDRRARVAALVLAAPAGIERFRPGHAAWLERYQSPRRAFDSPEVDLRHAFSLAFARHDDGVERLLRERVRMSGTPAMLGTSLAVSRSVAGMLRHPVFGRLGEIAVPTLVVFGTEDRMIPNRVLNGGRTDRIARLASRAIPGSRLVLVHGAGHTVHHDAPDVFNRALDGFLGEVAP